MSLMREAMAAQPDELRRLLQDRAPAVECAQRLRGRRVYLVGTGTSHHAAQQGAWWLRAAGVDALAVSAADAVAGTARPAPGEALLLLTHRGTKQYTTRLLRQARADGVQTVVISKRGNPDADLPTCAEEGSSAFTVSHLCALLRCAQLAVELGGRLGPLERVPDAVEAELAAGPTGVRPPRRLLEYIGYGINGWTASEGALKARETSYVATAGGNAEEFLHGPSVALSDGDRLVALDGGGGQSERLHEIATVVEAQGAAVELVRRPDLGETLSVFPLTAYVQKVAVELAETRGTNPDSFGKDVPGHQQAWARIAL